MSINTVSKGTPTAILVRFKIAIKWLHLFTFYLIESYTNWWRAFSRLSERRRFAIIKSSPTARISWSPHMCRPGSTKRFAPRDFRPSLRDRCTRRRYYRYGMCSGGLCKDESAGRPRVSDDNAARISERVLLYQPRKSITANPITNGLFGVFRDGVLLRDHMGRRFVAGFLKPTW